MRYFLFSLLLFAVACSQESPKDIPKKINQLIAEDHYEQALDILDDADASETPANLDSLKERVHLNYGLFKEYHGTEGTGMRERMTGALRQYVAVLKINPDNQKATSEVQQIMGIYNTMPDKSPDDDVIEDLQELGFNFGN